MAVIREVSACYPLQKNRSVPVGVNLRELPSMECQVSQDVANVVNAG